MIFRLSLNELLSYGKILGRLFSYSFHVNRFPWVVSWAITYKCNLNCFYCRPCRIEKVDNELSGEDLIEYLDFFIKKGVVAISVTGGEPLLHPLFFRFVQKAKKHNVFLSVNTNGTLILEHLEALRLCDRIVVSLDGPEEINSQIRGGDFKKITAGILELKRLRKKVRLQAVIGTHNAKSLEQLIAQAKELDVPIGLQLIFPYRVYDFSKNPLALESQAIDSIIERILTLKKIYKSRICNSYSEISNWKNRSYIKNCGAGISFFRIEPSGALKACGRVDKSFFVPLASINYSHFKNISKDKACQECSCYPARNFNSIFSRFLKKITKKK